MEGRTEASEGSTLPDSEGEFLSPFEIELVDFVEAYHTKYGQFPSRVVIETVIRQTGKNPNAQQIDNFYGNPLVERSLNARGIYLPTQLENSTTGLSTDQLTAIAVLTNPRDSRSDAKKLNDYGISPRRFAGWMLNKQFAAAMKDAADNLFENSEADAHVGLVRKVRAGDLQAIKFYFEMTGRYNPAYESQVNVQALMSAVIEAIQKHVHDPATLMALAGELQLISVSNGINSRAVPVQPGTSSKTKALPPANIELRF